jgi:predicted NUDIX family NTP pyrophosphohydrolase
MASRKSAGLLMYRFRNGQVEVLLAHPGGPYFSRKDDGYWTLPKGEIEQGEDYLETAIREFKEEVGLTVDPGSPFVGLGSIRQRGGKVVHAWAVEGDYDSRHPLPTSTFEMEWPPHSGKLKCFPEVDRIEFYPMAQARVKVKDTHLPFLERLEEHLQNRKV